MAHYKYVTLKSQSKLDSEFPDDIKDSLLTIQHLLKLQIQLEIGAKSEDILRQMRNPEYIRILERSMTAEEIKEDEIRSKNAKAEMYMKTLVSVAKEHEKISYDEWQRRFGRYTKESWRKQKEKENEECQSTQNQS